VAHISEWQHHTDSLFLEQFGHVYISPSLKVFLFITQVIVVGKLDQLLAQHALLSESFISAATSTWYMKII
jgi:hypothetical protein